MKKLLFWLLLKLSKPWKECATYRNMEETIISDCGSKDRIYIIKCSDIGKTIFKCTINK